MAPTLEDILNLPTDVRPEHLQMLGLLAPQAAAVVPPAGIAGVTPTTPAAAKPPTPIGPYDPSKPLFTKAGPRETRLTAGSQTSPAVPMTPPGSAAPIAPDLGTATPGSVNEKEALAPVPTGGPGKLTFKERQALPTVSSGVAPGSVNDYENQLDRQREQRENPWGSDANHPGWRGKLAHVAAKIGNIAGDIVAPGTMALIPGTELNKRIETSNLENRLGEEKSRETTGELAKAKEKFEENQERVTQQNADTASQRANTGDDRVAAYQKKIDDDNAKHLSDRQIGLRKLGLEPDPNNPDGAPIPLTRDHMSEAEKNLQDYKIAQAEGVNAKAALDKFRTDPDNPQNKEAIARIKNMAIRAGQAAEALGIKRKEFMRDTYGTDEKGDPIPGVETTDEGTPVGTKVGAKNDKLRAGWEKNYEKNSNDVERSYQMYQEALRAYAAGDRKTGAATMLALSQHIGTTFGQTKGSRQTQELIKEHKDAIGLIDRIERFGNYLARGDELNADQMNEFGDLIKNFRKLSWEATAKEANRNHLKNDFLPLDLAGLYKSAPANTAKADKAGNPKPAAGAGGGGGAKTYTQADVDAAVTAHPGTTAEQIEKAFKDKNYTKH